MTEPEHTGPVGSPFAVADRVYCCWAYDNVDRTLEYLDGVDPSYFATVAGMLGRECDGEDAMAASMALRVLYHQGVETLMSLLGAAAQGPTVVPAWIAKCGTGELKEVVRHLAQGRPLLTELGTRSITFDELSRWTHQYSWTDEPEVGTTAGRFARLWARLAGELLDDTLRAEYNALKHGTRVSAGGFSMAIGLEESFGVDPPQESMRSLGGSEFGSTFFVAEKVGSSKDHVRTRRTSLNWHPRPLGVRLQLISMSLNNIGNALRAELGADASTLLFIRPIDPEAFDTAWAHTGSIMSTNFDESIHLEPADEVPQAELRSLLEGRSESSRPS